MTLTLRTTYKNLFRVDKRALSDILSDIKDGAVQLPSLQRSWSWLHKDIVSLLGSIGEGHPIGAILTMETGGSVRFKFRPIAGSEGTAKENMNPSELILDGQQRLTGSFQSLMTSTPVNVNYGKNKNRDCYFFFNIEKAINENEDLEDAISTMFLDKHGRPSSKVKDYTKIENQASDLVVPLNRIFQFDEWRRDVERLLEGAKTSSELDAIRDTLQCFRKIIVESFEKCEIAVTTIKRGITADAVVRLYEKLNTAGLKLNAFDLQIARYAADGHNLQEDWEGDQRGRPGYKKELDTKTNGLFGEITSKQFLHAVSALHYLHADVYKIAEPINLPLPAYKGHHAGAFDGFMKAYAFLHDEAVFKATEMPPTVMVTGLAVLLAKLGHRAREADVRAKLRQWLWCCSYVNRHAKGGDKSVAADLPLVMKWIDEGVLPTTLRSVKEMTIWESSIAASSKNMQAALTSSLLRQNLLDFATGRRMDSHFYLEHEYELHHIFPRAWCKANGISDAQLDSIVNKTPISKQTNIFLSGSAPSEYLARIEKDYRIDPWDLDRAIASHGINPTHLRNDDFKGFFSDRKEFLLLRVEQDTGRQVLRGDGTLSGDEDDQDES